MNQIKIQKKKNNKRRKIDNRLQRSVTIRDVAPDTMNVELSYHGVIDMAAVTNYDQVWNLNSLFDPDRTGVGHQPTGYDQWSAFYNRYRVDAVDVEITVVNFSAVSVTEFLALPSNDSANIGAAGYNAFTAACESPLASVCVIPNNAGNNVVTIKKRYYPHVITGVPRAKYRADDLYSGQTGASPTEVIVLHCCGFDFAGGGSNITLKHQIKMTYHACFFDRLQLPIS